MDAFEAMRKRRSVRSYTHKPVAKEAIEQIIDAGRRAPSGVNQQPWEFFVVTDDKIKKQIAAITDYGKFIAASVCIAVYCRATKYYLEDGYAATENILIAATALGLGTCWVVGDKKPYCGDINRVLKVPSAYNPDLTVSKINMFKIKQMVLLIQKVARKHLFAVTILKETSPYLSTMSCQYEFCNL